MPRTLTVFRLLAVASLLLASTAAQATPLKIKHCEEEVTKYCVSDNCPKYCGASAGATADALADCKAHCTATDYCKITMPTPKHNALEELVWTELQACIHEENPSHVVEPPARTPLPSNEPKFVLKRITPTAKPSVPVSTTTAKPAPAKPAATPVEPEPHWNEVTTPSWKRLLVPTAK